MLCITSGVTTGFKKVKDQKKKAFKAQVDNLTEDMSMSEASVASLVEQVALLKAELAMKADKVFLDIPNTTKIKPKLFDSGNNYSVVADISHSDPNTNITLTYSEETLGTAGGPNLPVRGDGQMEKLPSVYVPDANASMISVQQFWEQRDAVALFLKDSAVGIKLNNKILKYHSKIRKIAKLQGLELIKSHVNDSNLYEIHTPNSNPHNTRNLYQGHYTGEPRINGYSTYYFRKYKM